MLHNTFEIKIPYDQLGIDVSDSVNNATITTYIKDSYPNDQDPFFRTLIVICPGGGYHHHSPREAEAIAVKLMDMGINSIVLRYSLSPVIYPAQLFEAAYAVKYAREHAKEWDVNPDRIFIAGFSAGGHVAGLLSTLWNSKETDKFCEIFECSKDTIKPNAMILGYPVITSGEFAHKASFERSLGEKYDELVENVSIEKLVGKDTPPAFIWHTFEDRTVPMENSLLLVQALRKAEIPFDYHVFSRGMHGLGLGTIETASKNKNHYEPQVSTWPQLLKNWMEKL